MMYEHELKSGNFSIGLKRIIAKLDVVTTNVFPLEHKTDLTEEGIMGIIDDCVDDLNQIYHCLYTDKGGAA